MAGWPGPNWQRVADHDARRRPAAPGSRSMNWFQVLAADLLFALDHELELQRQLAGGLDPGLGAFDVREHLPLVVGRAAGVEVAVADRRLEGRRDPLVERIGRLHVVVAVDQHRRRAGHRRRLGIDDRMAGRLDQFDREASAGETGSATHSAARRTSSRCCADRR